MLRTVRAVSSLLLNDPRLGVRKLKSRLQRARNGPVTINGVRFRIDLPLAPVMHQMYFGCYEGDLTRALRRVLCRGDTFIDVGANVGYISAYCLGLVGPSGAGHAFEPVPRYFERLDQIRIDNSAFNFTPVSKAAGAAPGRSTIAVANHSNIGWNTMVPGYMAPETTKERLEIDVIALADYIETNGLENIKVIKIDAEGYEFPVLQGLRRYLAGRAVAPYLFVEVAPAAYAKLGSSLEELRAFMTELGYVARTPDFAAGIAIAELVETANVIFVPRSRL